MVRWLCSFLLVAAALCWPASFAQRSHRRAGSGGSHGYSSFGRSSSGRRWNNGVINTINPPSHKGFAPTHIALSIHNAAQRNEPYRYTEEGQTKTARMQQRLHKEEDSGVESVTQTVTDSVTETTVDLTATEPSVTGGPLMRRLRDPSGPHIVRDSWCRVSESKDCLPAL